MQSFYRRLSLLAMLALFAPAAASAQSPKYNLMIVFGDSLSDTGNLWLASKAAGLNPAVPPSEIPNLTYFFGRFSNGPVGIEYLWDLIKPRPARSTDTVKPFLLAQSVPAAGAVNFAFGGSGTAATTTLPGGFEVPGFLGQIGLFARALGPNPAPSQALYVVFTGANDYFGVDLSDPTQFPSIVQDIVSNIVGGVTALYGLGARHVMVMNLPNLSLTPLVPDLAKPAALSLTLDHNALLAKQLDRLALPGLQLIQADVFAFLERLTARSILTPALPAPASTCLFTNPASCPNVSTFDANTRRLFWDAQHPTTATHSAFGHYLHTQLLQQQ